ncbi:class E sortase [Corynebacterium falsenii]|uniref:class E sortase n=1 Tax=Corynebacterium falsenii TaxID=108486 RepID=UPI00046D7428|nr:class E sortase [Corynebacterium falsenii]UBI05083.1 class E sortase [Corynebacterium falsenii]
MSSARRARTRRLDPVSVLGEILVTLGVLALLFAFWDVVWTNVQSAREQSHVAQRLDDQWDSRNPRPLTAPSEGTAFARLFIPSFGSDFDFAVVKGTSDADLRKGPGQYLDSQDPDQPGNFALAGHRVGRGSPFNDLGLLHSCDAIVVETAGSWNVYRVLPIDVPPQDRVRAAEACMDPALAQKVTSGPYEGLQGRYITTPGDVEVINPIPNQPSADVAPDDASLLTMTTCHPQFSNRERMIVHAVMVRSDPKKPGYYPPEMTQEV